MLELPFKPFTLDEVKDITGVPSALLDRWAGNRLVLHSGSGSLGLTYMQTFAVFVAVKYISEGASDDRVNGVLALLACMHPDQLLENLQAGRSFPVPKGRGLPIGVMVELPEVPLAQRLCLKKLLAEFRTNIERIMG